MKYQLGLRRTVRWFLIAAAAVAFASAVVTQFVLIDALPKGWQFENLPHWLQYSVIGGCALWFTGELFSAFPFPRTRSKRKQSDEFRCIHCGTTIGEGDQVCPSCSWSWREQESRNK